MAPILLTKEQQDELRNIRRKKSGNLKYPTPCNEDSFESSNGGVSTLERQASFEYLVEESKGQNSLEVERENRVWSSLKTSAWIAEFSKIFLRSSNELTNLCKSGLSVVNSREIVSKCCEEAVPPLSVCLSDKKRIKDEENAECLKEKDFFEETGSPVEHEVAENVEDSSQTKNENNETKLQEEEPPSVGDAMECKDKEKKGRKKLQPRQKIGVKKRNVFVILDSEPICSQPKRPKKSNKTKTLKRKCETPRLANGKLTTEKKNHKCSPVKKIRTSNGVVVRQAQAVQHQGSDSKSQNWRNTGPRHVSCSDSGLGSGDSSGSFKSTGENPENNGSAGDGSGDRGFLGGGGGGGGSSGGGGGRDDESGKRPLSSGDINMEEECDDEEEEKEEKPDQEMTSVGFSGSKDVEEHSVDWQHLQFDPQDIQHVYYNCSKENCPRAKCAWRERNHFEGHDNSGCQRCVAFKGHLKTHAKKCCRPGCRVYNCGGQNENKVCTAQAPPKNGHHNFVHQGAPQLICGTLIYPQIPGTQRRFFTEGVDYQKKDVNSFSKGANGEVFRVLVISGDTKKELVLKETNYLLNVQELEVYKRMGQHPNIVDHYGITLGNPKGSFNMNIFMEQCDMSLRDYLDYMKAKGSQLSVNEAMFYWTQVCMAVDHIHTSGIIHKDIKAKNVLLCLNQGELHRAKLSDFDSSMWLEQEFTAPGLRQAGTRGFAAPEVMEKEPHGRPADIHSLGVLLFELMGGVPPIDDRTTLKKRVKDLGQISPDVKQIVERCIQDDPTLRPTVKDLLADDFLKQYQQVSSEV